MPVARTVRIMHRARECKVHAEQTSRPDASEWTELRASLPPSPPPLPYIPAWCTRAYVHMCAPGVLKDTRAEDTKYSRRVLTSHEEESRFFPSSLIFRAGLLPLTRGLSSCLSSPTFLWRFLSLFLFPFFPSYRALFQSLVYRARAGTHAILFEPFA